MECSGRTKPTILAFVSLALWLPLALIADSLYVHSGFSIDHCWIRSKRLIWNRRPKWLTCRSLNFWRSNMFELFSMSFRTTRRETLVWLRLRNSGNPKLANSRFVNFIDKVSKARWNTMRWCQGNRPSFLHCVFCYPFQIPYIVRAISNSRRTPL